jgi:hypothetical protein
MFPGLISLSTLHSQTSNSATQIYESNKMLLPVLITLFSQFQGLNSQAVDANGITLYEKIEELERQLLNPFTLVSLVSPCSVNFGFPQEQGEQTSAEWVRIVFHDVITANIAGPGLGLASPFSTC